MRNNNTNQSFSDIKNHMKSGDIILFSGAGPESELIEVITHGNYSHVGMVVDLPDKGLCLWSSDTITVLEDDLDGGYRSGVHLIDLSAVLDYCMKRKFSHGKHYTFAWRALEVERTSTLINSMEAFMKSVDGRAFPSLAAMAGHYFEGVLGIKTDEKTYFCAELIADTYKHMNLLGQEIIPNGFSPSDFSDPNSELKLLSDAKLAEIVPFTYSMSI